MPKKILVRLNVMVVEVMRFGLSFLIEMNVPGGRGCVMVVEVGGGEASGSCFVSSCWLVLATLD